MVAIFGPAFAFWRKYNNQESRISRYLGCFNNGSGYMPTLSGVLGFGVVMRRVPLRLYASALELRLCIFLYIMVRVSASL